MADRDAEEFAPCRTCTRPHDDHDEAEAERCVSRQAAEGIDPTIAP